MTLPRLLEALGLEVTNIADMDERQLMRTALAALVSRRVSGSGSAFWGCPMADSKPRTVGPLVITRESYSVNPWRVRDEAGELICSFPRMRDARAFAERLRHLPWSRPLAEWNVEQRREAMDAYRGTDSYRLMMAAHARAAAVEPPRIRLVRAWLRDQVRDIRAARRDGLLEYADRCAAELRAVWPVRHTVRLDAYGTPRVEVGGVP